jgi:hypothetical protein
LGVKLDKTLNWDEHIELACKNVEAGIGISKHIEPYVPANILISIYNALADYYYNIYFSRKLHKYSLTSITAFPFGESITKH